MKIIKIIGLRQGSFVNVSVKKFDIAIKKAAECEIKRLYWLCMVVGRADFGGGY